jgi:predicted enzyme related to lactoylglutathione lyase
MEICKPLVGITHETLQVKKKMNQIKNIFTATIIGLFVQLVASCGGYPETPIKQPKKNDMTRKKNPVVYFEIPVQDMERAVTFYQAVLNVEFEKETIDNNEMALFPFTDGSSGISGALAKGEIYKPTKDGVVIYFNTENIDETMKLATAHGGKILYPKTDNGIGLVAEFEDIEGNRIALYQPKE